MSLFSNSPATKRDVSIWAALILASIFALPHVSGAWALTLCATYTAVSIYGTYIDCRRPRSEEGASA